MEELSEGAFYGTTLEIPMKSTQYVTLSYLLIGYWNEIQIYHSKMYIHFN